MGTAIVHMQLLGYPLNEKVNYDIVIEEGPKNKLFTEIVAWLSGELQVLCEIESCVHPIAGPEDSSSFLLEVSSFLKDMCCPHSILMEGPVSQRLLSLKSKLLLIEYLCTELEAARVIAEQKPPDTKAIKVEMQESATAKDLKEMLICLGFSKPPPTVTTMQIFSKVEAKVSELLKKTSINDPLFCGTLTEKQWFALEKLQSQMHDDYKTRREMLLKRLDVTIQSFNWSERLKTKGDQIEREYTAFRKRLSSLPNVHISDLLSARNDLPIIEKTSSASVRQNMKSLIYKELIGAVPDRGGRPEEQQPPPPEVPSWQKNENQRPSGIGGGDRRHPNVQNSSSYEGRDNRVHGQSSGNSRVYSQSGGKGYNQSGGASYDHGGNANYGGSNANYSCGGMRRNEAYQGGWNQGAANAPTYNIGYAFQNQSPQYAEGGYMAPLGHVPTQFYTSNDRVPHEAVFGVGMGGYAATGGNFYQYGPGVDNPQRGQARGGRGNRGRGRGGRRGRGP